jgi:hypothetical protein
MKHQDFHDSNSPIFLDETPSKSVAGSSVPTKSDVSMMEMGDLHGAGSSIPKKVSFYGSTDSDTATDREVMKLELMF